MNRPVKIILIILSILFGLYLLIGGLLTLVLGDRTKRVIDYEFNVTNKTTDTLYIEKLPKDINDDNLIIINGTRFLILPPNTSHFYFWDNVIDSENSENYNWPVNTKLSIIRNRDTLDFVFDDKNLINIETDIYGNYTITRTIN